MQTKSRGETRQSQETDYSHKEMTDFSVTHDPPKCHVLWAFPWQFLPQVGVVSMYSMAQYNITTKGKKSIPVVPRGFLCQNLELLLLCDPI